MTKLTPAQSNLLKEVAANQGRPYVVQAKRNGYKVAQSLLKKGLLIDITAENKYGDLTVKLPEA